MRRRALEALLYFPERGGVELPASAEDVWAGDVHGWWFRAPDRPPLGHVLFCHGNAGNVADRLPNARLLVRAGFDVLLFDYRGYGRSRGRPSEEATYEDARAARGALLERDGVDPGRVLYLGESLGGAVALRLAHDEPPAGLVLQSTFTSVRDMAAVHYRVVPGALVPDAYPSLSLVADLRTPLLVLHGERDEIVPVAQGRALFDAAPEPKRLHLFPDAGHNDLIAFDGDEWAAVIKEWWLSLPESAVRSGGAA
jgi:pimeloyl-ACP methyl ester carboxylesterase